MISFFDFGWLSLNSGVVELKYRPYVTTNSYAGAIELS